MDEGKRLCDVRPFQPMLKVVEKKGDKAETTLNFQISNIIGKGKDYNVLFNNFFYWTILIVQAVIFRISSNNIITVLWTSYLKQYSW